jgi:hypothetical protein
LDERDEEMIEYVARSLRDEPVRKLGSSFDARVMASIKWGDGEQPSRTRAVASWFVRPRNISLSPLSGLAAAAAIAAAAYLGAGTAIRGIMQQQQTAVTNAATLAAANGAAQIQMVQFVFVAPEAKSVSLVGDFNEWNARATPLASSSGNLWTVQIPLTPGRYNYVFMVDGAMLVPDPTAPRTAQDEFGQANSVITVGSSGT